MPETFTLVSEYSVRVSYFLIFSSSIFLEVLLNKIISKNWEGKGGKKSFPPAEKNNCVEEFLTHMLTYTHSHHTPQKAIVELKQNHYQEVCVQRKERKYKGKDSSE